MDTIIALCHHSSHSKILDSFLKHFSNNYTLKFMTIPDTIYKEGETRIDYKGSITDPGTYASIPDKSVTAYINTFCFQQIKDIEIGLEQIHRTLKPKGYYVVSKMAESRQLFNDTSIQFFKQRGYSVKDPIHIPIFSEQPTKHVELTEWFILQKPDSGGKRTYKRKSRFRRRGRKTYKR